MTALIPRVRRQARFAAEVYASPNIAWPGARTALTGPGDADGADQRDELRAVAVLSGSQDSGNGRHPPVGNRVNLVLTPAAWGSGWSRIGAYQRFSVYIGALAP